MHDRSRRERKAETARRVLSDFLGPLASKRVLDLGTSTGIIGNYLAEYSADVTGIDIDAPAVEYARATNQRDNLHFVVGDGMQLPFSDNSFDVVICAQIYEHVPDANRLVDDIHRVLKPGGVCYFAAGNRLMYMEPHYRLPFLSVLPKFLAHRYMRLAGRGKHYYETHRTYWGLRKLVREFEVIDYSQRIIDEPVAFACDYMLPPESRKQRIARSVARFAYWLMPGYIWLLRKPLF